MRATENYISRGYASSNTKFKINLLVYMYAINIDTA